jgi:hypothetical protein
MTKRAIGIDIGSNYTRAVQITRVNDAFHIEKIVSEPTRRSTDSPLTILKSLFGHHGFDERARVALALSHLSVFYREIKTGQEPDQANWWTYGLPIEPDQTLLQACIDPSSSADEPHVLVAATSKDHLKDQLVLLKQAGLRPVLVDAEIFAVKAVQEVNYPGTTTGAYVLIYIDEQHLSLAIIRDGRPLAIRNTPLPMPQGVDTATLDDTYVPSLCNEINITWQKVCVSQIDEQVCLYIATGDPMPERLCPAIERTLGCSTVLLDPRKTISCDQALSPSPHMAVAAGLALRLLSPTQTHGLNFLVADKASRRGIKDIKNEMAFYGLLVGAIMALWIIGCFIQLFLLESRYNKIKDQIRDVFVQTLPQEKNIVYPLAQAQQKLEQLQQNVNTWDTMGAGQSSALHILERISVSKAEQGNINVEDLLIAGNRIRIRGTCPSFEQVYRWQERFTNSNHFMDVQVRDPRKEPDTGLIHFTLELLSGEETL